MLPPTSGTQVVAFVATSRPSEALAFYRDKLGLRLTEDSPFALVFDAFGTMLRVQKVGSVNPHPYTSFGFDVPDIEAAVRGLNDVGVDMLRYAHFEQDALGVWTAPSGARIAWCHDPDGNVLSLSEF
ncbi:MAG TPA: VOC family protein [Polyangiaceae bacterium]|nr:VOC family protein [Polyangiaceae bacterium]